MEKFYQISDLEAISGIKAPTIRMWEQRYNLISPNRTDSNRRLYSEETFKKFLLIVQLYYSNVKISNIAKFSIDDLNKKAIELIAPNQEFEVWTVELHKAVLDYDSALFNNILIDCNLAFGFITSIANIIIPYLYKIEVLFKTSTISSTHRNFAIDNSTKYLYKVYYSIAKYTIAETQKKVVLFTDDDFFNQFQLRFAEILFFKHNYSTIFIQNILNQKEILKNLDSFGAKRFVTIAPLNQSNVDELMKYVEKYTKTKFYIIDLTYKISKEYDNLFLINHLEDLDEEIY